MTSTTEGAAAAAAALDEAIQAIGKTYFDVTIICTTDDYQAQYWMELLENGLLANNNNDPSLSKKYVVAVSEDWNDKNGAGNGLGTLYAWQKACAYGKDKYQLDWVTLLMNGTISAALYHTAGKGTRLAPLPASENNNKPGVKLPFPMYCPDGTIRPLTVLESVVRQTGIYARPGRLSVFWGDQVFIPTAPFRIESTHHADILCTLLGDTAPTEQEWVEQGLEKYGVIVVFADKGNAAQVEKVSHGTALSLLADLKQEIQSVGPSLGSFSVSAPLLQALCSTFASELISKDTKYDTDPHFWMPLTLPENSYVTLMKQKGTDEQVAQSHYERMQTMKNSFLLEQSNNNNNSSMGLFGAVNVGKGACWWDYGLLKLYSANTLLLLDDNNEPTSSSKLLRQYLGLTDEKIISSTILPTHDIDTKSYIVSSTLGCSSSDDATASASVIQVRNSLLANVSAPSINCDGATIVNCIAKHIQAGPGSILYNIIASDENETIVVGPGEVLVGIMNLDPVTNQMISTRLRSRMDIDGGTYWKEFIPTTTTNDGTYLNDVTFEQVHEQNKNANIVMIAQQRQEMYDALKSKLNL